MGSGNSEDHHVSEGPINTDRDQLGEETNPMPGPLVPVGNGRALSYANNPKEKVPMTRESILNIQRVLLAGVLAASAIFLAACGDSSKSTPAGTETDIEQSATTATYALALAIGPSENMLTPEEAKTAKEGEVMVSGEKAMTMSGMEATQHLEVFVKDRKTGAPVSDQMVTIKVTNDATKEDTTVPVAAMYGLSGGVADMHFGNNVTLMPGNYTIVVTVGNEPATFMVNMPKK